MILNDSLNIPPSLNESGYANWKETYEDLYTGNGL